MEIEAVTGAIPGVAEVAVIAAPDENFGETPAGVVTVTGDVHEPAIVAACSQRLADYKVPRYVVIRRDPRLPTGKIAKSTIRRDYADVAERYARVR